jgi:hypothetical protein
MQIDSLPEWIIARIEWSAICVKFVRKYEHKFILWSVWFLGIRLGRSVFVDELKIGGKQRNLASSVDPSEVEATLRSLGFRD